MKCSGTQQWDSMSARVLEIFETTIMSIWKVRCSSIDPLTFLDRDVWHVLRTISMLNQVIQDAGLVCVKYSKRRYNFQSFCWMIILDNMVSSAQITSTFHWMQWQKQMLIYRCFFGGLEMAGIRPSLLMNSGEISISRSSHRGKHQRLLLGACDFLKTTSFQMFRDVKKCGCSACW